MHPRHWAEVNPYKPAIIAARSGRVTTYRELNERSTRCANLLRHAGLKAGDHVAAILEKTRDAYNDRGWSTLGDIGYLDADGYLYLTDRKSDVIITGGVNVYPIEAEHVLTTHPKVLDAAVFGIPDEDLGEAVHAIVQPVSKADIGPELERLLLDYCRSKIAHYKCPRSIDFRDELPRHETGKLYKRLLKAQYLAKGHVDR